MRLHRPLATIANLACVIAVVIAPAPARADEKARVKVAMIYNIMRFITFPDSPRQIRVCGLAGDSTASDLRALSGRVAAGAKIDVVLLASPGEVGASCDVAYLESASPRSVGARSRGQVLIGSGANFADNGGTVGLINFGGQVRFVVNDVAARRSGVTFSAQLLQLAARVIS